MTPFFICGLVGGGDWRLCLEKTLLCQSNLPKITLLQKKVTERKESLFENKTFLVKMVTIWCLISLTCVVNFMMPSKIINENMLLVMVFFVFVFLWVSKEIFVFEKRSQIFLQPKDRTYQEPTNEKCQKWSNILLEKQVLQLIKTCQLDMDVRQSYTRES